jgi:hypothetical protein
MRAAGTGCLLRAIGAYLLFVLASVVVTVSAGYIASGRAVRRAEAGWAQAGEPMDAFAARFPVQGDSPAGIKLDALTRPLGIQLSGPLPASGSEKKAQAELLQSAGKLVGDCAHAGTDACASPPSTVASFLLKESARLDAIETQILDGGPLHWEQDVAKGMAAPMPRLLGHRYLQNLLLARALMRIGIGTPQLAARPLEASWTLNASLSERPDLISRLLAVSIAGMQHGVLRTLRTPSDGWRSRMQEIRFADSLRVPYQLEAWNWTRFTSGPWGIFDVTSMETGKAPPRGVLGRTARFLTAPYVRLCFAGVSEAMLRVNRELPSERRCDIDMDRYSKVFEESFPRWNILGRIATPSLVRAWTSFRYADLDRELTQQVFASRAERRTSGRWPTARVASTVCEGLLWEKQAGSDGTLTLRTSMKPFTLDEKGWLSVSLHP